MATRIQLRRDVAANWTSNNPTLANGEVGFEYDTMKFKIGDGSTAWTSLGYQSNLTTDEIAAIQNASTPSATNPFQTKSNVRQQLTGNTTYYVDASTGSDSNDGLTALTAFLTIQKAADVIQGTLDLCGYQAKVQVAAGTYTAGATVYGAMVGQEQCSGLYFVGDTATPANVHIQLASGTAFYIADGARCRIRGFKISGQTNYAIDCIANSHVEYGNMDFGAAGTGGGHIEVWKSAVVDCLWATTISGGGVSHWHVAERGQLQCVGITYTLSGTPAFSAYFVGLAVGNAFAILTTFTGSGATGPRYLCYKNSVLDTGGGGANYFPGNSAGTTATGGQYI